MSDDAKMQSNAEKISNFRVIEIRQKNSSRSSHMCLCELKHETQRDSHFGTLWKWEQMQEEQEEEEAKPGSLWKRRRERTWMKRWEGETEGWMEEKIDETE